jgi:hypothetical protein
MRRIWTSVICGSLTVIGAGCTVNFAPVPVSSDPAPEVVDAGSGPVVEGPGVEVVTVEPDPALREYVYDPGYPPGAYFYDGYYWYGGYRYPHDVFINQYVAVNVREHRFADAAENRQRAMVAERDNRREFAQNHGVRNSNPHPTVGNPRPKPNLQPPQTDKDKKKKNQQQQVE